MKLFICPFNLHYKTHHDFKLRILYYYIIINLPIYLQSWINNLFWNKSCKNEFKLENNGKTLLQKQAMSESERRKYGLDYGLISELSLIWQNRIHHLVNAKMALCEDECLPAKVKALISWVLKRETESEIK